uniref:Uncharacterized protein n=1 Tax=Meloidogyne enterolobii TaxID=390850 RepID=A0A6V7Y4S5_MELEN|nr:unnamed protein product [Meloidogyne enterolobii]
MVNSKIFKIIFALFVLCINIMEIWSCTGLGGYTGLGGLPFNPSILQNPDLPRMIQTMPPHQIVQLLPLYGSLANQYPQYIPLIIGMLTPDQRYALANSPMIAQYPAIQPYLNNPYGGPQVYGPQLGFPQIPQYPQGQGILPSFPQGQGILATYPSTHSRIIFKNLREVFLKKVKVTDIMLAFLNLKYEKKF